MNLSATKWMMVYLAITLVSLSCPPIASAANLYDKGVSLYQSGDHRNAKRYFHHIVDQKPDHWKSHYLLGNIYLQSRDFKQARKYYFSCVENYPDIPTCKKIKKAIEYIDQEELKLSKLPSKEPGPTNDAKLETVDQKKLALAEKIKTDALAQHSKRVKEIQRKKDKIIQEANMKAQAIIEQAQKRVGYLRNNSNTWVRNTRTNEVHLGLATIHENEIMNEAKAKAHAIREQARIRAQGFHLPKAPVHAQALAEQLMAKPGPSGTQLHHIGTNAHVRNYIHKPSKKKQTENRKIAATDTHSE